MRVSAFDYHGPSLRNLDKTDQKMNKLLPGIAAMAAVFAPLVTGNVWYLTGFPLYQVVST